MLKVWIEREGLVDTFLTHRDKRHGIDQAEQPPAAFEQQIEARVMERCAYRDDIIM